MFNVHRISYKAISSTKMYDIISSNDLSQINQYSIHSKILKHLNSLLRMLITPNFQNPPPVEWMRSKQSHFSSLNDQIAHIVEHHHFPEEKVSRCYTAYNRCSYDSVSIAGKPPPCQSKEERKRETTIARNCSFARHAATRARPQRKKGKELRVRREMRQTRRLKSPRRKNEKSLSGGTRFSRGFPGVSETSWLPTSLVPRHRGTSR